MNCESVGRKGSKRMIEYLHISHFLFSSIKHGPTLALIIALHQSVGKGFEYNILTSFYLEVGDVIDQ